MNITRFLLARASIDQRSAARDIWNSEQSTIHQEVIYAVSCQSEIPVETGNEAAKAGKLGTTIQAILADLKPEAVYFTDDKGQRTAFLFLDMQDVSQIPAMPSRGYSRSRRALRFIQ